MNTSTYLFLLLSITVHAVVFTPISSILFTDEKKHQVNFKQGKSSFRILLTAKNVSRPKASEEPGALAPKANTKKVQFEKNSGVKQIAKKISLTPPEYPEESRLYGEEGEVTILVTLNSTGAVERVSLLNSSGFDRLDQSVLTTIKKTNFEDHKDEELELSFKFELQD